MYKEFLWLSKIKPIASHQAERIQVYIWPTLFGRTIINLWNYNLKHNEGKLLRKIPLLMNEVRHHVHCSALHHPPQHLDWKSLSVPAATVPCRDRALYFHTGRWISRRWTKPGTLPRISGSRQAIWFSCWSHELTLYPQRAPYSRALVPFIIITKKALIILLTMELVCTVLLKRISVRWNIKNPVS